MAALQIRQSLEILYLCINDVVGSYTKWGCLHGNGPISWSFQNLFTHPTLSSLFNILHPSNTHIMQTLHNFNSDPTSYIHTNPTINDLFVRTDNVSLVSWIQDITPIFSSFILHNNLFHHANLWIPRTHLPTPLKYFCLNIISQYLENSWTFYMQLSHATILEEYISAHRFSFHIHQKSY